MTAVQCLHCKASNDPIETAGYCEECGRKLPVNDLGRDAFAFRDESYRPARRGDSPEMARAKTRASNTLFVIAVLQVLSGLLMFVLLSGHGGVDGEVMVLALGEVLVYTVVFALLGWWARYMPLPASLIGLVIYVLASLVQLAAAPDLIGKGIIIKVAICAALISAVVASAKASNTGSRRDVAY
jgi:hypothetical protein